MPTRHSHSLDAADVVIVGAGVVGAACAYYAGRSGLSVAVVDRGPVAGGTTGAGEGNLLVSDKEPARNSRSHCSPPACGANWPPNSRRRSGTRRRAAWSSPLMSRE